MGMQQNNIKKQIVRRSLDVHMVVS